MPWDDSANAGFSDGEPWLPLNADWRDRNVAGLAAQAGSILVLHQRLLALRRAHDALTGGRFALVNADGDVLAYAREGEGKQMLIALNLGSRPQPLILPDWSLELEILISTLDGETIMADGRLLLRADEGVILGRPNDDR